MELGDLFMGYSAVRFALLDSLPTPRSDPQFCRVFGTHYVDLQSYMRHNRHFLHYLVIYILTH